MAEPPTIAGTQIADATSAYGWVAGDPALAFTPSFSGDPASIDVAAFDWTNLASAKALVEMVKERYLAATFGASAIVDPAADGEDAGKAAYWASLQQAVASACLNLIPDAANQDGFQSLEESDGTGAFEAFCQLAGLTSADGSWGWAYATALKADGTPNVLRDSSARTCQINDLFGVQAMVVDMQAALAALTRFKVPVSWTHGNNNGREADEYRDDSAWDGSFTGILDNADILANNLTQSAVTTAEPPGQTDQCSTTCALSSSEGICRARYQINTSSGYVQFTPPLAGSYVLNAQVLAPVFTQFRYFPDSGVAEEDWIQIAGGAVAANATESTDGFGGDEIDVDDLQVAPIPAFVVEASVVPPSVSGDEPLDASFLGSFFCNNVPIINLALTTYAWDLDGTAGSTTDMEDQVKLAAGDYVQTFTATLFDGEDSEAVDSATADISVDISTTTTTTTASQ